MKRINQSDRGVTIVEASFALPIMFLFIFGLIDLGMWTLNSNQAANAARDGARAGILSYLQADVAGSIDQNTILAAVQAHLPDQSLDGSSIAVQCVRGDGTVTTCAAAEPDRDRIRVKVEWDWKLVTPIAGSLGIDKGAARGSATMAIVGRPLPSGALGDDGYVGDATTTTTTAASTCVVGTLTILPSPVESHGNQLKDGLTVTFPSDASPTCADLDVELVAGAATDPDAERLFFACACGAGPGHTWTYAGSDNIWKKNSTGTVRIFDGSVEVASRSFSVA